MDNHDLFRSKLLRADGIDPEGPSEVEVERFRQLLNQAKPVQFPGRRIMKSPIAKLTIAAAVIVAVLIGIHLFSRTSGIVWANVLEKVMTFDTCVFRTRELETTGPRPDGFEFATESESKNYRSDTYGSFSENYKNGELFVRHYTSLQDRQHLSFFGAGDEKFCIRMALSEDRIREFHRNDPKRIIMKILEGNYSELGEDNIDGKRVIGVELRDPNLFADEGQEVPPMDDFAGRFWIDVQTELPVWVEISVVPKGSAVRMTMVSDQFQWGVPLEASLFNPEIPPDYEVVDDNGKVPDSTPKTDAAEAFAQNTMAEPYLGDFDHLPLPDVGGPSLLGFDLNAPKPEIRLRGTTEIRVAQDACVAGWPRYEQVQAQLRQELKGKLVIDAMDVNELVTTGIALRNQFWEVGGCLSETSYPYAYASRLVMEMAHELVPENTAVIDQVIESIITYEVLYTWDAENDRPEKLNPIYPGLLTDLRMLQFQQLKAAVNQGHVPTWKDFVRCCDLMLLSPKRKDYATALEATRMLIDQVEVGGWIYYLDGLRRTEQNLAVGTRSGVPTFLGGVGDVSLDRYQRRLWSFQGPKEYRQNRIPMHLRHLKGW